MANFNQMLKQAQKMQRDVDKAQHELAQMEITYVGNGVEVVAKGDFSIKKISIGDDLIAARDKGMLEDVVLVAVNGALAKLRHETESKLSGITAGFSMPGLFGGG